MEFIKKVFWNKNQSRLRTGYRVIIQLILFILLAYGLSILLPFPEPKAALKEEIPVINILIFGFIRFLPALISVWLVGYFLDRRHFSEFGFHFSKKWQKDFLFGLFLGAFLMTLIFITEYLSGWITIQSYLYTLKSQSNFILLVFMFFISFILAGSSEEIVTRGYLIKNLAEGLNTRHIGPKWGLIIAWVFSSILFGFFHLANPNATVISTLNIIAAGLLLGYGYILTEELALPIGLHASWNFFQGNVFGFPISGLVFPSQAVTFIKTKQSGPDLWTGGVFGPEAGLVGLLAMILGLFLIRSWIRSYRKGSKLKIKLSEYINKSSYAKELS